MATQQDARTSGNWLLHPRSFHCPCSMIMPLAMTIYSPSWLITLLALTSGPRKPTTCSNPANRGFAGFSNYTYFLTDPAFFQAIGNTLDPGRLACSSSPSSAASLLALLLDQPICGQGIVRLLVISPFFVMPTGRALVWKNMMMHPVYGVFAWHLRKSLGLQPIDWFAHYPLFSIIIIVSWQWLPFATLILLTSLQSLDEEQKEAAEMDGAGSSPFFFYIVLPHLSRADDRGHPDRDDLPAQRLRRNLCHHQRRPGLRLDQPAVPRLPHRRCSPTTSAALPPAASSRSSSPTSSPSS